MAVMWRDGQMATQVASGLCLPIEKRCHQSSAVCGMCGMVDEWEMSGHMQRTKGKQGPRALLKTGICAFFVSTGTRGLG